MKRACSLLLVVLLFSGCGPKIISPAARDAVSVASPMIAVPLTAEPSAFVPTPGPTKVPLPKLPTCAPRSAAEALFPEMLLSDAAEPLRSRVWELMDEKTLTKADFEKRFTELIRLADALKSRLSVLSEAGHGLTADRRERTVAALLALMSDEVLNALSAAYDQCPGEGGALSLLPYRKALQELRSTVQTMTERTSPLFTGDGSGGRAYVSAMSFYMGEPFRPDDAYEVLEELIQTEAYALQTALTADPEAARKKPPISLGSAEEDLSFLLGIAQTLCPLPGEAQPPLPGRTDAAAGMDLFELAYRYYPGLAYWEAYARQTSGEQLLRWADAPDGYRMGLAVHCSYAVIPYIDGFQLDYLQYKWYEGMLDVTMTGMSALLIHYYGYTQKDLGEYLKQWGAEEFAQYLYEKAMSDPFESLTAAYGYYRYLDICQAALDAGCESEERFLRDYVAVGPAPYVPLKEYMVALYENEG